MTTEPESKVYELSLDEDISNRGKWRFDDEDYLIAEPEDYPPFVVRKMVRLWRQIQNWDAADTLTEQQSKQYVDDLRWLVKQTLPDLPDEVFDKKAFDRSVQALVVTSFFLESEKKTARLIQQSSLIQRSSVDSSLSTEELSEIGNESQSEIEPNS